MPGVAAALVVTVLHNFGAFPHDGANPYGGLLAAPNGVLYGTTDAGGGPESNGVVFSLTPPALPGAPWAENILWIPPVHAGSGINPYATLIMDSNGALYGTLFGGGNAGNGAVFALYPPADPTGAWTSQILHRFDGVPDAGSPTSGVVLAPGGVLYGTTSEAGKNNAGAVYSIQLPSAPGGTATESVLYSFSGGADGGNPFGPVTLGPGGVLYGTTRFGGANGYGCVFQLTPAAPGAAWTEQVLYSFGGSPDAYPISGVAAGPDGVLYGATFGIPQSSHHFGNVYQLTPPAAGGAWTYANIHAFASKATDAADPVGVTLGASGVLYGTANGGAASVFELSPPARSGQPWSERLLGQFGNPFSPVMIGSDGALYGVSFGSYASPENAGSVVRIALP